MRNEMLMDVDTDTGGPIILGMQRDKLLADALVQRDSTLRESQVHIERRTYLYNKIVLRAVPKLNIYGSVRKLMKFFILICLLWFSRHFNYITLDKSTILMFFLFFL